MAHRREQFGFTPQGQVLTAEEEYGFVPGGRVLESEMGYGFVPGGQVLQSEMRYGYVPSSVDLGSEMVYGDEGEDEYGDYSSLEEVSLFGADAKASEHASSDEEDDADDDGALERLEAEMDSEDDGGGSGHYGMYGAGDPSLQAPAGAAALAPHLGEILLQGFQAGFHSVLPPAIQAAMDRAGRSASSLIAPGDMAEVASALMADPAFSSWNTLGAGDRAKLVRAAVAYAAMPGVEFSFDDAFAQEWAKGGISSLPRDIGAAVKIYATGDGPHVLWAALNEIPVVGAALSSKGASAENFDQLVNTNAMFLYVLGALEPQIYDAAAAFVTNHGQDVIEAASASHEGPGPSGGAVMIHEETLVSSIDLPEPAQQIPSSGIGLPEPPQILAMGYGLAIAGSLLGFLG